MKAKPPINIDYASASQRTHASSEHDTHNNENQQRMINNLSNMNCDKLDLSKTNIDMNKIEDEVH